MPEFSGKTPSIRINAATFRRNAERINSYAAEHCFTLLPTIKTHRSPVLLQKQLDLTKVSAVEIASVNDLLLVGDTVLGEISFGYPLCKRAAIDSVLRLPTDRLARFVVSNEIHCDALESVASFYGVRARCLIAFDLGMDRIGAMSPERLLTLAQRVSDSPSLEFCGLQLYVGNIHRTSSPEFSKATSLLGSAFEALNSGQLSPRIVSIGSSAFLFNMHELQGITELRVGGAFLYDAYYFAKGICSFDDCAVTIRAEIVDRCGEGAVLNCGSKHLGGKPLIENQDLCYGISRENPADKVARCYEEISVLRTEREFSIGSYIDIVPVNSSVALHQFEEFAFIEESDK